MKRGQIQIYSGDGKGKTTASLGLILRALGHGHKVCLIQFMKKGDYGEIKALRKFPSATVKQFGVKGFIKKGKITADDKAAAQQAMKFTKKILAQKYDLVVLDEIIMAIYFGLIEEKEVLAIIKGKPGKTELILTGRKCSAKLSNTADLVTEMKEIKHYHQKGRKAREGIEY